MHVCLLFLQKSKWHHGPSISEHPCVPSTLVLVTTPSAVKADDTESEHRNSEQPRDRVVLPPAFTKCLNLPSLFPLLLTVCYKLTQQTS